MDASPKPELGKLWITLEICVKVIPFWALLSSPQPLFQSLNIVIPQSNEIFTKYGYKMLELGIKLNA